MIIVVLLADGSRSYSTELTQCEQVIVCPPSLRGGEIEFHTHGSGSTTAYLVKKKPAVSTTFNITYAKPENDDLHYGYYELNSFNLVTGSILEWDVTGDYTFDLYMLQGEDNYKRATNDQDFTYIKAKTSTLSASDSYVVKEPDEYFIILTASRYYSSTVQANYTVKHTRYMVGDETITTCSTSCSFNVANNDFPPQCVVVENPCSSGLSKDTITISYEQAHSGLFYCCLVFALIGGLGLVGAIVSCVACAVHKSKGAQGQTYQNVPSSTAVPAPLPQAYQTPQPYVQPQPAYNPAVPPVYVDPNVPTYNTYGTAPAPSY